MITTVTLPLQPPRTETPAQRPSPVSFVLRCLCVAPRSDSAERRRKGRGRRGVLGTSLLVRLEPHVCVSAYI